MLAAEFMVRRTGLGLTPEGLASLLGVRPDTVSKWESGVSVIPDGVVLELAALEVKSEALFNDMAGRAEAGQGIRVFRSNGEARIAGFLSARHAALLASEIINARIGDVNVSYQA